MTETQEGLIVNITPLKEAYEATWPGIRAPIRASTLQELAELVLRMPEALDLPRWKVSPWSMDTMASTHVSAEFLLDLLRLAGGRRNVDISGCALTSVDLSPSTLDKLAVETELRWQGHLGIDLSNANLAGAKLDGSRFQGAGFAGAQLSKCSFGGADLRNANFRKTDLREAWFTDANLEGASLSGAQMQRTLLLRVRLNGASFTAADLEGATFVESFLSGATFYQANLQSADFRGVANASQVGWADAKLDRTRLNRDDIDPIREEQNAKNGIGSYRQAMETFLTLKTNFSGLGNYEDAAWAYVKEQQMEKAIYFPTTAGKRWFVRVLEREQGREPMRRSVRAIRDLVHSIWLNTMLFIFGFPRDILNEPGFEQHDIDRVRWFRNWAFELVTGYGERPVRPILWGLVTILAFFFVYWGAGNIATGDPSVNPAPTHSFVNAFTHSVAAFATIGFNTLEPVGWGARLMTAVESMMGIGFFALFIYTLGNRMSRS